MSPWDRCSTLLLVLILTGNVTRSTVEAQDLPTVIKWTCDEGANYYNSIAQRSSNDTLRLEDDDDNGSKKLVADELILGTNYMNPQQLDTTHYLFYESDWDRAKADPIDDCVRRMSVSQFAHATMTLKLIAQSTSEYFINRYDPQDDLSLAAGPQVDQRRCLSDLEALVGRARLHVKRGVAVSRDINLANYLDAFAGSPRGLYSNLELQWLGSYDACRQLQIFTGNNTTTGGKHCVGSFRYKDWTSENFVDEMLSLRMAVCLPESCDSRQYANKFQLIKQLNDYTARPLDQSSSMELSSLYCAPDEGSELGTWWRSRPTLIVVALTCVWILILLTATYKDEQRLGRECSRAAQVMATSSVDKLCKSLSIVENTRRLLSTTTKRNDHKNGVVDLDVIEAIKVLAAMYIMSGHVILMAGVLISNPRELPTSKAVAWTITNLMPAFAVNAFFAITGILTSYLMFSKSSQMIKSFTATPAKWLAFILLRYSRIMPMYALVTLFCKHVARFIGDGPLWDYGTSSLAARRNCQQEPWAWTLLFGANFKSPLKHCIPPAWYLANDFQFCLITPLLLTALHLRPRLGKNLLLALIGAGYLAGVWSILEANPIDFGILGRFSPHAFMVYVNFVHESYTQPQYRIPAYLIGLLLGYKLYEKEHELERRRRAHAEEKPRKVEKAEVQWSPAMLRYGPIFSLSVLIVILLTPSVTSRIPWDRHSTQPVFALVMTTFHLVYALAVGIYVLLATTGNGFAWFNENFLKLALWRPLSRLGLCVMLVNVEVIAYLTQTSRTNLLIDNHNLTSLCVMSFLYSYLFAALAYVLFELPIRACLSQVIAIDKQRISMLLPKSAVHKQ